jgi:lipid-A-disaccharide synthase
MRQAGFCLLYDSSNWGAMGLSQAAPKIPGLLLALRRIVAFLKRFPPDLAILLDFGAFNLRLGPRLKGLGIPVLYYFPPGSWSKQPRDPRRLAEACNVVVSPFPWSAEALRGQGLEAHFFGHPLLDVYGSPGDPDSQESDGDSTSPTSNAKPIIGLFPGSRRHEVRHTLPHILSAAVKIAERLPDATFILSQAATIDSSIFTSLLRQRGGRRAQLQVERTSDTPSLLRTCTLAIVTSGTITLEAALCGVPMVVLYRGSLTMWLQYRLFLRNLVHMAMPNILAGHTIVPELLQREACGERIAHEALNILLNPQVYERMRSGLLQCTSALQPQGAVEKTARLALQMAGVREASAGQV